MSLDPPPQQQFTASPLATPSGAGGEPVPPLHEPYGVNNAPNSEPYGVNAPNAGPNGVASGVNPHNNLPQLSIPEEPYAAPPRSATAPNVTSWRNQDPPQPLRRRTAPASRRTDPGLPAVQRVVTDLFTPEHRVGPAPTVLQSLKVFFCSSWINVLLLCIPVGWALHFVKSGGNKSISDTAVFVVNFIAIIPLAGLLGFSTEEVSLRVGQTLGGLINATLGNAVELIVAIIALIKCEIAVTQSSLIGSILSNLLLVLGMCFFAGGIRFSEQTTKSTVGQLNASLLLVAVIAVLIPSAFHFSINTSNKQDSNPRLSANVEQKDILSMSHGVAVILLVIYCLSLVFQMWTHASLYKDEETSLSTPYGPEMAAVPGRVKNRARRVRRHIPGVRKRKAVDPEAAAVGAAGVDGGIANGVGEEGKLHTAPTNTTVTGTSGRVSTDTTATHSSEDSDDEETPQMNMPVTLVMMVVTAVVVGVTAEFMVSSINGLVESNPALSAEFVGLILLPIVSNAAEHFTAVSVSVKDKIDLSIAVAVGSSIQVAMFVIPVVQLLAWCISKPMTMLFDPFEAVVLFFAVLIVNQTLADGRSNWMEGVVLMLLYLLIAIAFWYYVPVEQFIECH